MTAKARDLLDKLNRLQRPSNDTIFGGLTAKDFQTLRTLMPQLVEASDHSLKLIDFLTIDGAQFNAYR